MHWRTEELLTLDPTDCLNSGPAVREEDSFVSHVGFRVLRQYLYFQSDCWQFGFKDGGVASK